MAILAWVTMGIAIWHFAIYVPDRYWGGIVGSFVFAAFFSVLFGFALTGFTIPPQDDVTLLTALEGIPGALIGLGLSYFIGVRKGNVAVHV